MKNRGVGRGFAAAGALGAAALLTMGLAASGEAGEPTVVSRGELTDLHTDVTSPFDGASAQVTLASSAAGATATLHVWGVASGAQDDTFGAHLHTGACVTNSGPSAGGHYNADAIAGTSPVEVSDQTEVWLDFTVNSEGRGVATAVVPFTPTPGTRSVVIHAEPTNHETGSAGARLACLPVGW